MQAVRVRDNDAGNGRIELALNGREAVFSELSYRYPLKLLSPRIYEPAVAIAYILSYGGGLVSGDRIHLTVALHSDAILMLLTQGSTKVFKHRPGQRLAKVQNTPEDVYGPSTVQRLKVDVEEGGLLLLLPDPVTCFSGAAYNQIQSFHLTKGASVVILDWITSGRMSRGEEWEFSHYYSINEIWLGTRRIARDALLLEEPQDATNIPKRTLKDRMGGYHCYAMLVICGEKVNALTDHFKDLYQHISVFQQNTPDNLVWSLSTIESGCVVRVAGKETELVRTWLRDHLKELEVLLGSDVYSKAFV